MVGVDNAEQHIVSVGDIQDYRVEVSEGVVMLKFECVCVKECLLGVYHDLAHVIGVVLWKVGVPHIIM